MATLTRFPVIHLHSPSWLGIFLKNKNIVFVKRNDRLRLVIELSRLNVVNGTGGPFGAAVFNLRTGKLLAPGVNMVAGSKCSIAHAEIMAIMAAQRMVGHYDLAIGANEPVELVSSTEPCAMCQGAIAWSGVSSLVYAARGIDACRIGFDEGPKATNWISQFRKRGITVTGGVCRKEAVAVLRNYLRSGGLIYNGAFNVVKPRRADCNPAGGCR
ncbi:MAG: nucleoside deaminase [bacterium]